MSSKSYITDFCTGQKIKNTPEENVRQEYSRILYEDYDYSKEQMDIEVPIQMGVDKGKGKRADIVIYYDEKGRDQYKDIYAVIETKRRDSKEGESQLKSYMSACSCRWGVWINGDESKYFIKDKETNQIENIFTIPKANEDILHIGKYSKENLKPVRNLKPIFKKIFTSLYSNTNISRREKLGSEMIKLIFCKIWDEKYYEEQIPKFRFTSDDKRNEKYDECKERIVELFNSVLEELSDDGIFSQNEEITLDAKSVSQVVGTLQQFSLMRTQKDVIGEAFEIFAESKLVGEKGEFFTPREVVKTAIQILDPSPGQTIFDPACGSGGFLIYALDYIWSKMDKDKKYKDSKDLPNIKKELARRTIFGSDKEHDLVRIAKAYMSIIGDGKSQIIQENMLHPKHEFQSKSKDILIKDGEERKFDFIITNPPFGSKIKINKSDNQYFDLGHSWSLNRDSVWQKGNKIEEREPQALFIELCLRFLSKGGTLAIVLPETYFHAPTKKYIVDYLSKSNNIKAVIDLPHNSFRPYCNAKTILIIIEKGIPQTDNILMGVAEEIGHDHLGKTKYRLDHNEVLTEDIWDDSLVIRNELEDNHVERKYTFNVKYHDIKNNILVPRYYWKKYKQEIDSLLTNQDITLLPIKDLINEGIIEIHRGHGSPRNEYKGAGEIPYVRAGDIGNWAVYKNPVSAIPVHEYKRVKANKVDLKFKDIVFVKEGSYRIGDVAVILPTDVNILLNSHCFVIRCLNEDNKYGITAYYLAYLLTHPITKKQLINKIFIDTTLPNIGDRWQELLLPIENKKKKSIITNMEAIFSKRIESENIIKSIYK